MILKFEESSLPLHQAMVRDLRFGLAHGRAFHQAIRSKPGYAEARYNYAVLLAREERYEEARVQLDAAVSAQPDFEPARALRDNILELLRR